MQPNYSFIVKDRKFDDYRKIASFLFLMNAIIFVVLGLRADSISHKLILFTSSLLLFLYAAYNWLYKKKKEKSYIVFYLLIAAVWAIDTSFWYFSLFFILLLFLQLRVERDFTIEISDTQVTVNGFVKKQYPWSMFNNIILKDYLLTLDFSDNKVLQVQPYQELSKTSAGQLLWTEDYDRLEKEFNDFCSRHLASSNIA